MQELAGAFPISKGRPTLGRAEHRPFTIRISSLCFFSPPLTAGWLAENQRGHHSLDIDITQIPLLLKVLNTRPHITLLADRRQ